MAFVHCLNPSFIRNPYTGEKMALPCGKCDACRCTAQGKWVTRLNLEASHWPYVVFFTLTYKDKFLPRVDLRAYCLEDDSLNDALSESYKFCELHNFNVPCVKVRDVQLFIKRLRKQLYELETEPSQKVLRYHITSEYGPTTFRPHYHGILFFRSQKFSEKICQRISQAWSLYHRNSDTYESFGRIDAQYVCSDAASYVASYTTFISYLPAILRSRPFKPFALHSSAPPIGTFDIKSEQIQEVFHQGLCRFAYKEPQSLEVVYVPLWRTLKDFLFPKIKGFNDLTHYERTILYGIADFFPHEIEDFDSVVLYLKFRHIWDYPEFKLLTHLFGSLDTPFVPTGVHDHPFDVVAFKRLYQLSRNVLSKCALFNVTLDYYVSRIELYYKNLDSELLKSQLQDEVDYCSSVPAKDIRLLPYLIDPYFEHNQRNLPWSVYFNYEKQFGLFCSDGKFLPDIKQSDEYKTLYFRTKLYTENSNKTRVKNEYVESNEFAKKVQESLLK